MSKIFEKLPIYAGKWNLKAEVRLDDDDKKIFSKAKVVTSQYGTSACFFLKEGGEQYIPMSNQGAKLNPGDEIDLDKVSIQVLGKQGESDIFRVKVDE